MALIYTAVVFALFVFTLWLYSRSNYRFLPLLSGFIILAFGFIIEISGVNVKELWYWNGGGLGVLGIPYIALANYFLAGVVAGLLILDDDFKRRFNKFGDKIFYYFLFPLSIIYFVISGDYAFFFLSLALLIYSQHHRDTLILKLSVFAAAGDIIVDNLLISMGTLSYVGGYPSVAYFTFFIGGFFIMSFIDFVAKKVKKPF
jgi:hypothetical protein